MALQGRAIVMVWDGHAARPDRGGPDAEPLGAGRARGSLQRQPRHVPHGHALQQRHDWDGGALVGGSLWGLYWVVTGVIGRMHAEDAFAALRIQNYKNFLLNSSSSRTS